MIGSKDITLNKDRNGSLWKCLLIFTVCFAVMAFLVYLLFIINGKTFLRYDSANRDAFAQRYMFVFEFKRFLENLFQGGEINTWDWSIGLGADAYTFNVSQIFSPFAYILCLTPEKYVDVVYTAMVVIRVYLSGVTFILFAKKMGLSDYQTLLGAITYTFCPWIIKTSIYQGTFMKATALFPLIMLGEEKIIRKESPLLFILTVGYAVLTIFSFSYMIALIVLLYFFVRMATLDVQQPVIQVLKTTAVFILSGIAGILTAGAGLMVTLLKFGETTGATGKTVRSLWSMTQYLRLPMRLMTWTSAFNSSSLIGISAIGIVMIPIIVYLAYKRNTSAVMTIILFIFVLFPGVNSMFNFFSYPSGRWMFALAFFYSLAAASCFDREILKHKESKIAITAVFALYSVYLMWIQKILDRDLKLVILVSWLACVIIIAIIWLSFREREEEIKASTVFDVLVIVSMCAGVAFCYNVKFMSEYDHYLDVGEADRLMGETKQRVVSQIDDKGFWRVDQAIKGMNNSKNNEQMYFGNRSNYGFYSNIDVGWIEYNKLLDNSQSYYKRVRMRSNDNRFGLDLLQGTKYFIGDNGKKEAGYSRYAGYGFEPYKKIEGVDVLKNRYDIGLGCTFDSYIRRQEWEKLSYPDREAAMLMAVVVPDGDDMPEGMKELKTSDVHSGIKEVKYTIEKKNNNNKLIISVDNDDDHQLMLFMKNVKVAGESMFTLLIDNGTIKKTVVNSRGDERGFPDMKDFMVNLGSGSDAGKKITIEMSGTNNAMKTGVDYDDLIIYSVPLSLFNNNAERLVEHRLDITRFDNDHIKGNITAGSDEVLYLSILDNYGWDVYVDGKKTEPRSQVDMAFMGVDLQPGYHEIELIYHTEGFWSGVLISVLGIIFTVILCIVHFFNCKREAGVVE